MKCKGSPPIPPLLCAIVLYYLFRDIALWGEHKAAGMEAPFAKTPKSVKRVFIKDCYNERKSSIVTKKEFFGTIFNLNMKFCFYP
jgi:hypothetical protein